MPTETRRMQVDSKTPVESIARKAEHTPVVFDLNGKTYELTLTSRIAEGAYASISTIDGRQGDAVSNEEILEAIRQSNEENAQRVVVGGAERGV